MKRSDLACLLMVIAILLPSLCLAGKEEVATTGGQFLKISPLARLTGMGGACAAISDDAGAFYSNPAGLSQIKNRQASFSYLSYFQDISLGQISYLQPTKWATLGVNIHYLGHKDIDRFDNTGGASTGKFGANSKAIFFSAGRDILKNISGGLTLKLIKESIWDYDSNWAFGLDLGEIYQTPLKNLRVGLLFQNIGSKLKFREKSSPLPFNLKLGASYHFKNLTLALDGNLPKDQKPYFAAGAEHSLRDLLFLRAGWHCGPQDEGPGLSAGFGLKWQGIDLDYSYEPFEELGKAHRLSLSTRFDALGRASKLQKEPFKILDEGNWTKEQDRLTFSWTPLKEIREYEYSLGSAPFKNDLLDWTSSKRKTKAEINITLIEGKSYYLTVRTKKGLPLLSRWETLGTSDGIKTDFTPPQKLEVTDEGAFSQANDKISFKLSTGDDLSGISEIIYCVGTSKGEGDVVPWIVGRPKEEITISGLSLKDGVHYYLSVRAKDAAGNISRTGVSDGIIVDASPPVILSVKDEGDYTGKKDSLHFEWEAVDKESGISEYQYCLGTSPKKEDLIPFKSTLSNQIVQENLTLVNGRTYYLTLRAKNKAGAFSQEVSSDGIKVDFTPPIVEPPEDEGEETEKRTLTFKWPQAVDDESRVVGYWLCVGEEQSSCDVFDGEVGNLLFYEIKEAKVGKTYYARVKAKNEIGLWSDFSKASDGIKVVPESYGTANSNLKLEARIVEDSFPGTTKVSLKIKNLLGKEIPVHLNNFTLITQGEGKVSFAPQINPLSGSLLSENLAPGKEKEDFLVFNTSKPAKLLLYQDANGNNLSLEFP